MKNFKKVLRLVVITLLFIVFAAFCAGMGGVFMPEFYRDDSFIAKIELVEERENDELEDEDEKT